MGGKRGGSLLVHNIYIFKEKAKRSEGKVKGRKVQWMVIRKDGRMEGRVDG